MKNPLVAAPGIFFWVFLKKHKLHNLMKRKYYILTTTTTITTIKKHEIHKVLQHKTCGVQLWLLYIASNVLVEYSKATEYAQKGSYCFSAIQHLKNVAE